jgi:hypothetical protein
MSTLIRSIVAGLVAALLLVGVDFLVGSSSPTWGSQANAQRYRPQRYPVYRYPTRYRAPPRYRAPNRVQRGIRWFSRVNGNAERRARRGR